MRLLKLLTLTALSVGLGFCQENDCETLDKCQEALKTNKNSSLLHFRAGEILFQEKNCQEATNGSSCQRAYNEFRYALSGDLQPKWTEVWSHINLGKIFDLSNQRERALNEYRLALRTKDDMRGALDEARKYIKTPYGSSGDSTPPAIRLRSIP
jgi:hypothetical protein